MAWIGIALFGVYSVLILVDEWRFHRSRRLSWGERRWRLAQMVSLAAAITYALCLEMTSAAIGGFAALLAVNALTVLLTETDPRAEVPAAERLLHSGLAMLWAPMAVWLGVTWKFIDGANFLVRWVLPLSTHHLRALDIGFVSVVGVITLVQVFHAIRESKAPLAPVTIPEESPAPAAELPKVSAGG
jgi:hypothetical protein